MLWSLRVKRINKVEWEERMKGDTYPNRRENINSNGETSGTNYRKIALYCYTPNIMHKYWHFQCSDQQEKNSNLKKKIIQIHIHGILGKLEFIPAFF